MIKDSTGENVTTDAAILMVKDPLAITSQPEDFTAEENTSAKFTVKAAGSGLTYQWQYSADDGKTWADSAQTRNKTATLTIKATAARNGMCYRCKVNGTDGSLTTEAAKLTVADVAPVIRSQPETVISIPGRTVTFKVSAAGTDLEYQWQFSVNNGKTWNNSTMSGYDTAEMKVPVTTARNGYLYRCIVTNKAGSVTSFEAKLTVQ